MEKTKKGVYWLVVAMFIIVVAMIVGLAPMQAQADTGTKLTAGTVTTSTSTALTTQASTANPYPDVTIKKVGKYAWNSIKFVKAHGGYKGVIRGTYYKKVKGGLYKKVKGKFQPNKKVTYKEFLAVLANLYGESKVPVSYTDVKNANKTITAKYACNKMVKVAKNLGVNITWKAKKTSLNRASAANYLYVFATYNSKLMPA